MKKLHLLPAFALLALFTVLYACSSDDSSGNKDDDGGEYEELSPVVMDLSAVPYAKLSDYKFFKGDLKNLDPAYKVLPYNLNSELFTDYALKKRFVWMPKGTMAAYTADAEQLNFPAGTALIKNFYYENVQPDNTTRIIETRIMIKKADGWIFANYKWNDEQTEAVLDMDSSIIPITWNQDGITKTTNYKVPSESTCTSCHAVGGIFTPIGTKPQNLNKNYTYNDGVKSQLAKWKEEGYLNEVPENILSSIDWKDTSKSLDLRARSYLDINCAHCHSPGGSCDYTPMNLAFAATANPINAGVCVEPLDFAGDREYLIEKGNPRRSVIYFRMETTMPAEMMPLTGRTLAHTEGLKVVEEWIAAMEGECP